MNMSRMLLESDRHVNCCQTDFSNHTTRNYQCETKYHHHVNLLYYIYIQYTKDNEAQTISMNKWPCDENKNFFFHWRFYLAHTRSVNTLSPWERAVCRTSSGIRSFSYTRGVFHHVKSQSFGEIREFHTEDIQLKPKCHINIKKVW